MFGASSRLNLGCVSQSWKGGRTGTARVRRVQHGLGLGLPGDGASAITASLHSAPCHFFF